MTDPQALARPFIRPEMAERFDHLYARRTRDPKSAEKWSQMIFSSEFLRPEVLLAIPSDRQQPVDIVSDLQAGGAPLTCTVVSEDPRQTGSGVTLEQAVASAIGSGFGTLIICSDTLGYYEGEGPGDRFILSVPN